MAILGNKSVRTKIVAEMQVIEQIKHFTYAECYISYGCLTVVVKIQLISLSMFVECLTGTLSIKHGKLSQSNVQNRSCPNNALQ